MTERGFRPDYAVPPGATLREALESMGMSQAELALRMGRPKKTVSELANGKAAITADTAVQLERVLGVPAHVWLALESNYREDLARLKERELLADALNWAKEFPIHEMTELGWLKRCSTKEEQAGELLSFFGTASVNAWHEAHHCPVAFRKSTAHRCSEYSVLAWLRKGELQARAIECAPFTRASFRKALLETKKLFREGPGVFVPAIRDICSRSGVAAVFIPELPRAPVSGAARWVSSTKALIQLSLRYKTEDHLWFSFYHEAGHLLLHQKRDRSFVDFVSSPQTSQMADGEEEEANRFAEEILIPSNEIASFLAAGETKRSSIVAFAKTLGVTPGIVVGRLQHEGLIPWDRYQNLKLRLKWSNG